MNGYYVNTFDYRKSIGHSTSDWSTMVMVMREEEIHFCTTVEQIYIVIDLLSTMKVLP